MRVLVFRGHGRTASSVPEPRQQSSLCGPSRCTGAPLCHGEVLPLLEIHTVGSWIGLPPPPPPPPTTLTLTNRQTDLITAVK